jgi:hypothetical protein
MELRRRQGKICHITSLKPHQYQISVAFWHEKARPTKGASPFNFNVKPRLRICVAR